MIYVIGYGIYQLVDSLPRYRLHQGMNNRDYLIDFFFQKILENPFSGFGMYDMKAILISSGLQNTSFHNYLLDYTFSYGLVVGVIIIILLVYGLVNLYIIEKKLSVLFLMLIINSFFVVYSIGGFNSLSIIFSLLLIYSGIKDKNTSY